MNCDHEWRQRHEEAIIGGHYPSGWECRKCHQYVPQERVTPEGLAGVVTKEHVLVGINGYCGNCSDGSVYKKQILHEDGTLTIERPIQGVAS